MNTTTTPENLNTRTPEHLALACVDRKVAEVGAGAEALIAILQAVQREFGYLPEAALRRVAEVTAATPADVYGVASFYAQFRLKPAGRHTISVCHGTACHVKGAERIQDALCRHLKLTGDQDTDADGTFTLQKVACLGCCTLAPVMQIDGVTYGHLTPESVVKSLDDFLALAKRGLVGRERQSGGASAPGLSEIRIGVGSCCVAGGSLEVGEALERAVREVNAPAVVKPVGCVGMCHQTPLVEVVRREAQGVSNGSATETPAPSAVPQPSRLTHHASSLYARVTPAEAEAIVRRHFPVRGFAGMVKAGWRSVVDRAVSDEAWEPVTRYAIDTRDAPVCAFLGPQKRIATEYCGDLDPLDLDEYLAHDGFAALRKVLAQDDPGAIVDAITRSGLRGRGGAGFPTGRKWAAVRAASGSPKYVVLNGDEGDPGAFMDRMLLESYPYRVLEGMAIAAHAVGASEGWIYTRAEYPLAVKRLREAIQRCEERGLLGESALGSGFSLKLRLVEGAGAFVCGEETALLESIEGRRGTPRLRPPYPAESGLWGKPTSINNVETYALVPWIVRHGWEAFAALGTETSKGTKVFALTGKVRRGGLIEVPMGVTIREVVEEIGGGAVEGRSFKAVQIGGPSGGCIPAELCDIPIDYESLASVGGIMGSGGLVVLDDRTCMVDMARYFLQFTQNESCGKCTFCRVGTRRLLDILDRLCTGHGRRGDLEALEQLAGQVKQGSLCGLGQTAPNPALTTLRYFRDEYQAHIEGRCPAGKCTALSRYRVTDDCIGCTKCAQDCPVDAIPMRPFEKHTIDDATCTRCDTCRVSCPVNAIVVE